MCDAVLACIHVKGQANILADKTLASVKSPYFGAKDFAFAFA
jgi:hypothetical protein